MTLPRSRPPGVSDERTQLVGWLDLQRALVRYKCEGLSEADARRALLPTSPVMTIAGLVSHLRWVEHCWFEVLFLGRPTGDNPQFGEVDDADFQVGDTPLEELLAAFERQCAISNEIVGAASLDDRGRHPEYGADTLTLRWMLHPHGRGSRAARRPDGHPARATRRRNGLLLSNCDAGIRGPGR